MAKFRPVDAACLLLVTLIGGGAEIFRWFAIKPFWTVGVCAAANPPGFCLPREAVLKLQYFQGFGWAALVLGVAGFVLGWRLAAALAVGVGIAAVVNYNGTTGILGAALGVTAWLSVATGRWSS